MKRITFLTLLTALLTIPIMMGQSGTVTNLNRSIANGPAGSATLSQNGNGNRANLAPVTLTQNSSQTLTSGAGCNDGTSVYDTSFFRAFDLATDHGIVDDFMVTDVEFGTYFFNGVGPKTIEINIYSTPGPFPTSALTLQGSATRVVTTANDLSVLSQPITATIPAGQILVYEVFVGGPDGANYVGFTGNTLAQTKPTYWRSDPCGVPTIADFGTTFAVLMNVIGEEATSGGGPVTYCSGSGGSTTYENISNVTYAGINNTTTTHSGYNDFTAQVANVTQGEIDQISVTINADGSDYVYVFIDWDHNGTLNDAGEVYTLASSTSNNGPFTMDITVPAGASIGDTRMRVKVGWLQSTPDPCGTFSFGEIEDYTVNVQAPAPPITYCAGSASSTTYENISNVTYAGINNTTTTHSGYNDFTAQVANVTQGGTDQISVTINADGSDYLYVFIDWDQNGTLDDAGEVYTLATSTSSDGPFTMDITVPAGASIGDTRMRVKVGWNESTPNPCGTFSFGEVEDYTVNVQAGGGGGVGQPPVIVCPNDITANNDPGVCSGNVNFSLAVAIDPEDGVITTTQTAGPTSGSAFPVGTTMVEFSATDSDGNTVTCQFEVTVVDNEAPIAVCQDITINLDPVTGMASISAADVNNGSTDNCGIDTMSLDISSFDCSMLGANTVILTVTDNVGNSSTCTSTVTVQDVTAPQVVCVGGFGTFTESEDFEGATVPAGWSTNILSGNADWSFGSGDMPTGPGFPTNAAIFDDDAAGSGESNIAQLLSPVYNLTGATSAEISFDYAFKIFGGGIMTTEVFDGADWQEVFVVDTDIDPTNTGAIDVTAYINPNFQVRYTYDDEGEWSWGAGVDNFLLDYQAASGGGLDVYLDASGHASISPNDLVTSVTEACNYTISAAGIGGGTAGSLSTMFASGNNGSPGGAVYFDITVGPADIEINSIDINTADPGAFTMDVYTKSGTYVGSETNAGAWTLSSTAAGTGAGQNMPSNATLASPITLSANSTYGMALVLDATHAHYYTNGDGTNQNFSNDDLALALGSTSNVPFTGNIFTPRIFNGTIHYIGGPGSGVDFTCADLGQNIIEVTVTDDSGNSSTCYAVVNVIDNVAPVIICAGNPGPVSTIEEFEGNTIPNGWTTVIETGTHDWTFGSGAMPTGGNFTSKAAIFNDDAAGSGSINKATLYSPVYDISASNSAGISFDYALQEFIGDGQMTVEVFNGTDWQQVLFVDTNTSPTNTGVLDVTGQLNANFQVRFIYDDEGGWSYGAGIDNFKLDYDITTAFAVNIPLGPDGTATIDPYSLIQSMDEACGINTVAVDVPQVSCADIGTPISVTIFVSDTSGNVASCTTMINVVDTLAPEIVCPADQTVDPGAGNLFYVLPDYFATGEATATDNCTDPVIITSQDPAVGAALTDGTHTITLTAEDEYGNVSTCSFELTVESIAVGIDENNLETGLSLYPNPAKSVVNLVNKTNISLDNLIIFDINGKKVNQIDLRSMQGEKSIDVSNLASGVYVIQITGENASTIKRLIKE